MNPNRELLSVITKCCSNRNQLIKYNPRFGKYKILIFQERFKIDMFAVKFTDFIPNNIR